MGIYIGNVFQFCCCRTLMLLSLFWQWSKQWTRHIWPSSSTRVSAAVQAHARMCRKASIMSLLSVVWKKQRREWWEIRLAFRLSRGRRYESGSHLVCLIGSHLVCLYKKHCCAVKYDCSLQLNLYSCGFVRKPHTFVLMMLESELPV